MSRVIVTAENTSKTMSAGKTKVEFNAYEIKQLYDALAAVMATAKDHGWLDEESEAPGTHGAAGHRKGE
jgi:hypothetical protein